MRAAIFLTISLSLLPACSNEQPTTANVIPQANAARVEAHIRFLADDLLQGRDTGSTGYAIAANYVAAEFAQLGVKPAGDNGSYFQPITFRQAFRTEAAPHLLIHTANGDETFSYRDEFITGPSLNELQQEVTAPLVFVGYGIDADWLDHHDYTGLDLNGKIAVILGGMPESFPSEEGAHFSNRKYDEAVARGAVGIITLQTPVTEKVYPFAMRLQTLHMPNMSYLDKDGNPADSLPQIKGSAALSMDASARLFALAGQSLDEVYATIERGLIPRGFDMNLTATLQRQSRHESITSPNVIGLIEGSDPELKNEYVVFTAHLDHVGLATGDEEDNIYNGALDNAAGVAALLENARLLTSLPTPPRRSILFTIVTGEEKGLLGADYFAHNPTVPIHSIVANVNLDMPVILYPFTDVIAFGAEHSTLKDSAEAALKALNLTLMDDPMPEEGIFVRSDHYAFVQQGVPSIFLATGFGSSDPALDGEAIFNDFLANHYHQVSDSVDLPIDYQAGALFAQVNFLIGLEVANADGRPRWNENDFFGVEFSRDN